MNRFKKDACVLRGGAWLKYLADNFRAHYRHWNYPNDRYFDWGFRYALPEDSPIAKRLVRIK